MTNFDRREDAFEAKFAHDEERAFKARGRAWRMLGLWAAEKCGVTGAAAEAYAHKLVADAVGTSPEAAFAQLVTDLSARGIQAGQIRDKRDTLFALASREVL